MVDTITEASGQTVTELRADGGASVMDVLCQFQADVLGVPVRRPTVKETTALGAASLAGLAEGVWSTAADVAAAWSEEAALLAGDAGRGGHTAPRRVVAGRRALPRLGAREAPDGLTRQAADAVRSAGRRAGSVGTSSACLVAYGVAVLVAARRAGRSRT